MPEARLQRTREAYETIVPVKESYWGVDMKALAAAQGQSRVTYGDGTVIPFVPRDINAKIDNEIIERERSEALNKMADDALASLDIERETP